MAHTFSTETFILVGDLMKFNESSDTVLCVDADHTRVKSQGGHWYDRKGTIKVPSNYDQLKADNERLQKTIDGLLETGSSKLSIASDKKLKAENERLMRLLESLTPGGSEFVNDPERCVTFVKQSMDGPKDVIKTLKAENEALKVALAPFVLFAREVTRINKGDKNEILYESGESSLVLYEFQKAIDTWNNILKKQIINKTILP